MSDEQDRPDRILSETLDSGFALRLMLKNMCIAVELAEATGAPPRLGRAATDLCSDAAAHLLPPPTNAIVKRLRQLPEERQPFSRTRRTTTVLPSPPARPGG
ncbi:NAD-binding protein [Sphaerisporangium aureirubrum]|uniref:NAD-binding protein n=1 Tax=Sphaerisporangium aureirubrum TaxID=1544736 RepID=A0ABW1NLW2_9ACTN